MAESAPRAPVPSGPVARAGANFALVKYWGKRDAALNLPAVGSISLTLEALHSTTRVEFDPALEKDAFELAGTQDPPGADRVVACLDRMRALAGETRKALVRTANSFPTGAGLASSASGFAALVTACDAALGLGLDPTRRSELARQGSGSAARSIFGGFVEMARGERDDGRDAVAHPLLGPEDWPLEVAVAVTAAGPKATGSTEGMKRTRDTSPFYRAWVDHQPLDLEACRVAIESRDFEALAGIAEASALAMHGLAMAARPGLLYFNGATVECLHHVRALRAAGIGVFFTVDAGPQVKAVCLPGEGARVAAELQTLPGVHEVIFSRLGPGACLLEP